MQDVSMLERLMENMDFCFIHEMWYMFERAKKKFSMKWTDLGFAQFYLIFSEISIFEQNCIHHCILKGTMFLKFHISNKDKVINQERISLYLNFPRYLLSLFYKKLLLNNSSINSLHEIHMLKKNHRKLFETDLPRKNSNTTYSKLFINARRMKDLMVDALRMSIMPPRASTIIQFQGRTWLISNFLPLNQLVS